MNEDKLEDKILEILLRVQPESEYPLHDLDAVIEIKSLIESERQKVVLKGERRRIIEMIRKETEERWKDNIKEIKKQSHADGERGKKSNMKENYSQTIVSISNAVKNNLISEFEGMCQIILAEQRSKFLSSDK